VALSAAANRIVGRSIAEESLRRSLQETYTEPSSATWGRGDVPVYCAHCAQNERYTCELLGYPGWVTEFDPDAAKPCGWVVYKDPRSIPLHYFERLGASRR
jgi:hypothetical protein